MHTTRLSEIMTKDLITVKPNDRFNIVDKLFKQYNFHHLPVVDEHDKLVGILSKSDYQTLSSSFSIFNIQRSEKENQRLFSSILVQDVMCKKITKLNPNDTVQHAANHFKVNLFHAIPIVDDEDKLLGMVTTLDLINLAFLESA